MKLALFCLAASFLLGAVASADDFRPDIILSVKNVGRSGMTFYNNDPAQTENMTVVEATKERLGFVLENDGSETDLIVVKAAPAKPGFTIKYILADRFDITNEVNGTGSRIQLEGGFEVTITAKVSIDATVKKGDRQTVRLSVTSEQAPALSDRAKYKLRVK